MIFGKGGYTTWEALQWLDGVGATFAHLSTSGRLIAASGDLGPDQPTLRRAQVQAAETDIGLQIVRSLLRVKLEGQRDVLATFVPEAPEVIRELAKAAERMDEAPSVAQALKIEARAAAIYWKEWSNRPVTFARADRAAVPEHWRTMGDRRSSLSRSPRLATTPVHAMRNYLYALAEFECRVALLAVGLDPGLGWAHKDTGYRDSAALDVLEAIRPKVDAYVARVVASRSFSRREFIEVPSGQVRLGRSLAEELSNASLPSWEQAAGKAAESVAKYISAGMTEPVRVPGRYSRGSRGKGMSTLGRGVAPTLSRAKSIPTACRDCGIVLDDYDRVYCDDCLPTFKRERTEKLVRAARESLAAMRASDHDPAQSAEAKAKRVAASMSRREAARDWERVHPGPYDHERYRSEILPSLTTATLPQMMRATGLSSSYCWRIRRGERTPHPMYWEALGSCVRSTAPGTREMGTREDRESG